jgi:hypothetical protein
VVDDPEVGIAVPAVVVVVVGVAVPAVAVAAVGAGASVALYIPPAAERADAYCFQQCRTILATDRGFSGTCYLVDKGTCPMCRRCKRCSSFRRSRILHHFEMFVPVRRL